jgi:hypothetical protein
METPEHLGVPDLLPLTTDSSVSHRPVLRILDVNLEVEKRT